MYPDWFKVGAQTWFLGFGNPVDILSIHEDFIDDEDCYWIGRNEDGFIDQHSLNEINLYWQPEHKDFRK